MTLRAKLLLAQLPLALSLLVVGGVSFRNVAQLDRSSQGILKDNHQSVLAAQRMRDAADGLGRAALAHARGRSQAGSDASELVRQRRTLEQELRFQEGNITEAGERELTRRTRQQWTWLLGQLDQLLAAPPAEAEPAYFTQLEPTLRALATATSEITTINQDAMVRKSDRARSSAEQMSSAMLALTLAALLFGLLASVYLTNLLTRPLSVLTQAVRRLGQGDLATRALIAGQDEIALVAREFNTMAERLADYRRSSLGELLAAQQSTQAAIDSLPDPVLVLSTGGELLNANQAAATLFAVDVEAADGQSLARIPPAVLTLVQKLREHIAAGKAAYVPKGLDEAVAVELRDGTRYFLARGSPLHGEAGQLSGLTILFQDVTRLRRFDELRTDMVATVAHEFRTPLTSLRMAIHLCAEGLVGPLSTKQSDLLFAARDDCERLQGIVDDLLDLSRIQAGKVELHRRAVSAAALLSHAEGEHRQLAREQQLDLRLATPAEARLVLADPDRVRLVFANLITNAIRHTPAGGTIELGATLADDAVRFTITDSGSGIASEHLPRLFERFFQVPGTPTGGAGLGLYICKEVVEAHGGRVGVEPAPSGPGSVFWFTLPAAQRPAADQLPS